MAIMLPALLGVTACGAFSQTADPTSTIEVDRDNREEGDIEGQLGDTHKVYDLEVTVVSVKRVAEYSEIDSRGYIEAVVRMENTTSKDIDYDRSDWRIEKPDGTISNTTNVADISQLTDDAVPAGGTVEGTVVFAVGEESGQFAVLFVSASMRPDDELSRERGVWVFESHAEDAE
ncbi:MAG: DUF4352 domain-containing protein [Acidimicrobiia bacterium]|nr:DUF4352 domain-containing protein [Acidimicrobiia bacterium]